MYITATRYHDFSAGHRVVGHEGACANLHGHNYRVHFTIGSKLGGAWRDEVGRVMDFSAIKSKLCAWLETNWDHRFLAWEEDPKINDLIAIDKTVVPVNFNPTAENLAAHLLLVVGPAVLLGLDCVLSKVVVEETRKCLATATK